MFCSPGLILGETEGVGSHFLVLCSRLIFDGTEGVGSRFHVLRSRTCFWRYGGRRLPFSCFALPNSFSAVPRASGPDFMFCAPGLIFGGTEGVRTRFHIFRARTCFGRYRGRRVRFSCFTLPYSFSAVPRASAPIFIFCELNSFLAVPRASAPIFIFCALRLVFGCTEGVRSLFHVLRSPTCFWRCGGRRLLFSCFPRPNSLSAIPTASGPVFMFCAPEQVFSGAEGVGSRFHVLRACTHFRRYRGRRVPFSCFALPDSFSAVPGASGPVFMF
jgi:hypothetical protein